MQWFWIQFVIFQAIWLIAILGGNQWLALCLILLAIHFFVTPSRSQDWRVLPIALIGIVLDAGFTLVGLFEFDQFPVWLGLLWVGFILTLGHSLAWLRKLPRLALVPIGAVAGTASYLAGWRLDAVELPFGMGASAAALAVAWALLLPVLVILDDRIRRSS